MGTKDSGFDAYAQGYGSRISVGFHYNRETDHDDASIVISGGWNSNARGRGLFLPDIDAVVAAPTPATRRSLAFGIASRASSTSWSGEAPAAIARQERKREKESREEQRLLKRQEIERKQIIATLDGSEKLRLTKLIGAEWDSDGNPTVMNIYGPDYANLRYDEDGETILVEVTLGGYPRHGFTFDITTGQWVLPFEPNDIGIEDEISGSGYGWRVSV